MRACPHCLTVYESDPEYCAFDGMQTVALLADDDPLEGARLDGFVLERRLGVGGTGCVYQGRTERGARVAIKLLFGEMATDKGIAERFRREARAMQEIRHKNVASVIDCKTSAAGVTYLAMEFVEGRTLKQLLEQEAPLAPGRVARLADQLVAGMAQAHRIGYVHRDLKPSNIIVGGPPGSEVAKILDFGIVASLHEQEQDSRLTKTGYIVGTPTYMAPEQVDPKSVTPQADVYALGVMIYEMLAGKPPFTGTLEQILVAKMTAPPPALEGVGELGELVMRLLAIAPEDRPPTALHVSAELARMSLMSADPATEKAKVPELPSLGVVGFGQATVILQDGPEGAAPGAPGPASISMDGTAPMGLVELESQTPDLPTRPTSALTRGASDVWVADTFLDPNPDVSTIGPATLDGDTPPDSGPDFAAEIPTRAELRPDTVVDVNPLDTPSSPEIEAATFLDASAPTAPEQNASRDRASEPTVDEASPADLPTRVESVAEIEGFGRPASSASGPRHPVGALLDTPGPMELPSGEVDVDDTALLAPVDDDDEHDTSLGFADTRIRPTHHPEDGSGPTWAPAQNVLGAAPPVPLVDPAEVAATAFEPALVRADPDDGPTSLSSLVPGLEGEDDDPGDGDTALDFSLDDVGVSKTDLELSEASVQAAAGFVDEAAPTPPASDARPGSRRWLFGLLFATSLLIAAVLTYRALSGPDVIEIPSTPESGATP